jgi:dTDP-4-dehydrorhamnose 3,5-epimerase
MIFSARVNKFSIKGLLKIDFPISSDDRGFFKEVIRTGEIRKVLGKEFIVRQMNHARSTRNTLRGIHVAPWNKIIYVTRGAAQVVIVDCRSDSATFGKYESFILGDENRSCIFVPMYCGNSYLVLSENLDYIYLTDQEWSPNKEKNIAWNDPTLAISWKLEKIEPILSEKDKDSPPFASLDKCK